LRTVPFIVIVLMCGPTVRPARGHR
jgi:hypothetical protein